MKQNRYDCNRLKGTSRCEKDVNSGKCPSKKEGIECCGRIMKGGEMTRPDSVFADPQKEVIAT